MALPATPPITLQQVVTEFGAPAGTPLSSFLRGGTYVPDSGTNAAVPTTLPIDLLDLLGASAAPALSVNIVGAYVAAAGGSFSGATARYTLTSGGLEQSKQGMSAVVTIGTWLLAGAAADYEVRATLTSGIGPTTGNLAVWENLGTTREWTQSAGVGSIDTSVLLIEIRPAGGGAVLDSAVVELESERF